MGARPAAAVGGDRRSAPIGSRRRAFPPICRVALQAGFLIQADQFLQSEPLQADSAVARRVQVEVVAAVEPMLRYVRHCPDCTVSPLVPRERPTATGMFKIRLRVGSFFCFWALGLLVLTGGCHTGPGHGHADTPYQPTQWHPWPHSAPCGMSPSTTEQCDCQSTVIDYPEGGSHDVPLSDFVPPPDFVPPSDVIPRSWPQKAPETLRLPKPSEPSLEPPVGQQSWLEPWTPAAECQRLPSPDRGFAGTRLENWAPARQPAGGAPPSRL
jgi:hypothetical protein